MGILNRKQGGERCEPGDDGVTHCQIYDKDKEGKMANGTDFSFAVDPKSCEPIMVGSYDVNEGDQPKVDSIIGRRVKACRKGL